MTRMVEDKVVGEYVKQLIFDEIVPTLDLPKEELIQFAEDVLERFKNPFVRHELVSISLNATTKYKTRILPSVVKYIEQNNSLPKNLLFALAGMIVFFKGERNGETIPLKDNPEFLELYKVLWSRYDGTRESVNWIVEEFLGLEYHWEMDLNQFEGLTKFVAESVYKIVNEGMEKTLKGVIR